MTESCSMSGKIDDPIDASDEAWPEDSDRFGRKSMKLALSFLGLAFPQAAILKILMDQFLPANRIGRIKYLFDAMAIKLEFIESEYAHSHDELKSIHDRLDGPLFQEAVALACEEATRAVNSRTIEHFAQVLVGSLHPNEAANETVDVAAMIRDVAQLGDQDIHALDILKTIFASVVTHLPNLNDPNAFTERMQDYRTAIGLAKIDPETFNATCARLTGFGLAIEVLRNPARMNPHEYCYRPTRRGITLLEFLERFK